MSTFLKLVFGFWILVFGLGLGQPAPGCWWECEGAGGCVWGRARMVCPSRFINDPSRSLGLGQWPPYRAVLVHGTGTHLTRYTAQDARSTPRLVSTSNLGACKMSEIRGGRVVRAATILDPKGPRLEKLLAEPYDDMGDIL